MALYPLTFFIQHDNKGTTLVNDASRTDAFILKVKRNNVFHRKTTKLWLVSETDYVKQRV